MLYPFIRYHSNLDKEKTYFRTSDKQGKGLNSGDAFAISGASQVSDLRLRKPLRGWNVSPPFLFRLCLMFWNILDNKEKPNTQRQAEASRRRSISKDFFFKEVMLDCRGVFLATGVPMGSSEHVQHQNGHRSQVCVTLSFLAYSPFIRRSRSITSDDWRNTPRKSESHKQDIDVQFWWSDAWQNVLKSFCFLLSEHHLC